MENEALQMFSSEECAWGFEFPFLSVEANDGLVFLTKLKRHIFTKTEMALYRIELQVRKC